MTWVSSRYCFILYYTVETSIFPKYLYPIVASSCIKYSYGTTRYNSSITPHFKTKYKYCTYIAVYRTKLVKDSCCIFVFFLRKIRTHLDLLSIPQLGGKNVKTFGSTTIVNVTVLYSTPIDQQSTIIEYHLNPIAKSQSCVCFFAYSSATYICCTVQVTLAGNPNKNRMWSFCSNQTMLPTIIH